ncbi:MAG TPA: hypothetical protein VLS90_18645 [Thermodesulfobacteriota bacterium]|nr:hypothetical protein [Thermodesulfobacteriota bacterium]
MSTFVLLLICVAAQLAIIGWLAFYLVRRLKRKPGPEGGEAPPSEEKEKKKAFGRGG